MSIECYEKDCSFHTKEEPICNQDKCCLNWTLPDFLLATPEEIFQTFILKAKTHNLEIVYKPNYYLWIKGNTNISVTSHVDTVDIIHYEYAVDSLSVQNTSKKIIHEKNGIVTATRNGSRAILGGDDRCGVTICYEQLSKPFDEIPHIFLFNGEEVGGIGSNQFVDDELDLSGIDIMMSIDCPYNNEFVWYGSNRTADKWAESYGWRNRGRGIFSDIMTIGNYYDFPCINFGCGYFHQHTVNEYIDLEIMDLCRRKLNKMMKDGYVPEKLESMDTFFKEIEDKHVSLYYNVDWS